MNRLFAFLLLLILPMNAVAQTVAVRSGDHADFSRLLLVFDAEGRWEFGRVMGGYEFRPENKAVTYDLSAVFELITRARIADVESRGDGRLFLRVDCECHGDAFDLRNGLVVLDIKDGAASARSAKFERHLEDRPPTAPRVPHALPSIDRETKPPDTSISTGRREAGDRGGLPLTFPRGVSPTVPTGPGPAVAELTAPPVPLDAPTKQTTPARVSETQAVLLEQIARAAAQGLLEADLRSIDNGAPTDEQTPISAPPETEPVPPGLAPTAERSHIAIETGVDRAAAGRRTMSAQTKDAKTCIPEVYFDVAGWGGTGESVGRDLGTFRGRTIGEFDLADSDGVTNLVRHYVYLTFGAEALALIRRYPDDVVRGDLLSIMAEIMDKGSSGDAVSLVDQMGCDGETALWAVLAQPRLFRTQPINAEAVALAFSGLPRHIRNHLGAGLTKKFLDIGDIETADMLKNAIGRGAQGGAEPLVQIALRFDWLHGDVDAARLRLDEMAARGDGAMPDALLDHVEAVLGVDGAVSAEQVTLLESLAFERRGTPASRDFQIAATRARAFAGDFDVAFSAFSEISTAPEPDISKHHALARELFGRLNGYASDETFLRHLLPRLDLAVSLPADDRRRLAKRLLDLGLTAPARQILGGEGALPEPPDRLLYARAAILEGRPEVAIGYLAGIEDDAAIRLRAEALERAGDHRGAFRDYLATGDSETARRMAWRGQMWTDLLEIGEGPMRDVARLMMEPEMAYEIGAMGVSEAPLAKAQALIDDSRAARRVFLELLDTTSYPRIDETD